MSSAFDRDPPSSATAANSPPLSHEVERVIKLLIARRNSSLLIRDLNLADVLDLMYQDQQLTASELNYFNILLNAPLSDAEVNAHFLRFLACRLRETNSLELVHVLIKALLQKSRNTTLAQQLRELVENEQIRPDDEPNSSIDNVEINQRIMEILSTDFLRGGIIDSRFMTHGGSSSRTLSVGIGSTRTRLSANTPDTANSFSTATLGSESTLPQVGNRPSHLSHRSHSAAIVSNQEDLPPKSNPLAEVAILLEHHPDLMQNVNALVATVAPRLILSSSIADSTALEILESIFQGAFNGPVRNWAQFITVLVFLRQLASFSIRPEIAIDRVLNWFGSLLRRNVLEPFISILPQRLRELLHNTGAETSTLESQLANVEGNTRRARQPSRSLNLSFTTISIGLLVLTLGFSLGWRLARRR